MPETTKLVIILMIVFCLVVPAFSQGKTEYLQRLETIISVDLQKNSYGNRYPLAYSVYHICHKVQVPFLYTISKKHSKNVNQIRIQPFFATASARQLIIEITHSLGYRYIVTDQGLYLDFAQNLATAQEQIRAPELDPSQSDKPLQKLSETEDVIIIPQRTQNDTPIYLQTPDDPETAVIRSYTVYPSSSDYYYSDSSAYGINSGIYSYPSVGIFYYHGRRYYYPYRSSHSRNQYRRSYHNSHPHKRYIHQQKNHSSRIRASYPGTSSYPRSNNSIRYHQKSHQYRSSSSRPNTSSFRHNPQSIRSNRSYPRHSGVQHRSSARNRSSSKQTGFRNRSSARNRSSSKQTGLRNRSSAQNRSSSKQTSFRNRSSAQNRSGSMQTGLRRGRR